MTKRPILFYFKCKMRHYPELQESGSDTCVLCMFMYLHVMISSGFFFSLPHPGHVCGGVLASHGPSGVRVGAGLQHPQLQAQVPRFGQVCRAAVSPRCERVLLSHRTATPGSLELGDGQRWVRVRRCVRVRFLVKCSVWGFVQIAWFIC